MRPVLILSYRFSVLLVYYLQMGWWHCSCLAHKSQSRMCAKESVHIGLQFKSIRSAVISKRMISAYFAIFRLYRIRRCARSIYHANRPSAQTPPNAGWLNVNQSEHTVYKAENGIREFVVTHFVVARELLQNQTIAAHRLIACLTCCAAAFELQLKLIAIDKDDSVGCSAATTSAFMWLTAGWLVVGRIIMKSRLQYPHFQWTY